MEKVREWLSREGHGDYINIFEDLGLNSFEKIRNIKPNLLKKLVSKIKDKDEIASNKINNDCQTIFNIMKDDYTPPKDCTYPDYTERFNGSVGKAQDAMKKGTVNPPFTTGRLGDGGWFLVKSTTKKRYYRLKVLDSIQHLTTR
eukprot:TRINITY_DN2351_c0_g1_i1.p1 TRINITY_DN2351_c0_g1~~TRINITY_DN2351_c0_g1_i1.p1  ORF type:complete len:144 (+),score=18.31 TRINITY_DN2351_c0_g1_i1:98-529(+)